MTHNRINQRYKMNRTVAVIIPYYKKINFIKNSIQSILNQNYKNIKILIIYDDKNLSDLEKIKKIFKEKKNIKYHVNNNNYGAAYSRNMGIKIANSEYCAFLDADDCWEKNKLKQQMNFMIKNNIKFSFTAYKKKNKNKSIIVRSKKKVIKYEDLLTDCPIGLSTVILEKSIIPKNLFPLTKTQEDLGAWLKITKKNVNAHYFDRILTTWNSTKNSLSKNNFQKIKDLFTVLSYQKELNLLNKLFYLFIISFSSIKRKFYK